MEQRLSIITLGVSNLKASKRFYDALGWVCANEDDSGSIVAYNLQHMVLSLYPKEKLAEDATVNLSNTGYSNFTLAYNVRSEQAVDETLEHVQTIGGTLIKPAQKAVWGGYSGYFADPDQVLWEVAFNPFATLGANGEFQWGQ